LFTELLAKANEVKNQLPQDAEDPVLSKEAADASALMYISFFSKELSNPQITDYLSRVIQPKLATLPGMAEAEILGNQVFAMRLWLDPVKLAGFGLSASDVTNAVRQYNFLSAAGEVKGEYVPSPRSRSRSRVTAVCCCAMWRGSRWGRKTTTPSARSAVRPRCTSASRPRLRPTPST
jgi:multidrug efflux pump subunit AcrB